MKLSYFQKSLKAPLSNFIVVNNTVIVVKTFTVILSEERELEIPEGYTVNTSKKPRWLRCILNPFSPRFMAVLIHDRLWTDQVGEIENEGTIQGAFLFSCQEFYRWTRKIAPNRKSLNYIEYFLLKTFSKYSYLRRRID